MKLRNSLTHPGDRVENPLSEQSPGEPRVEKTQREPKNKDVVKGVVDGIG